MQIRSRLAKIYNQSYVAYWCAVSSHEDLDLIVQKWKSLASHLINIHEHPNLNKFPRCRHGVLDMHVQKRWMKTGVLSSWATGVECSERSQKFPAYCQVNGCDKGGASISSAGRCKCWCYFWGKPQCKCCCLFC